MRNTVLATALTVVVGAVGATGYVLGRGSSRPATVAGGRYKVMTPPSILGGTFIASPYIRLRITNADIKGYLADGVRNPQAVGAHYQSTTDAEGYVQILGVWGTIDDPEQAVDRDFATLSRSATARESGTFVGDPKRVSPRGLGDAVMKCQMYTTGTASHPGSGSADPYCIWADHDTLGEVIRSDYATGAAHVTLDQDADTAAKVRADTRARAR
ncbi:hypothetical protein ACIBCO_39625 [Streptomyces violascens]|uniref:hypothetical protein n=1 Tax=Streptomyces violascens TaxID=67381 RepID=UPI0037B62BE7